ncbi:MAG: alpha/beta hydrolase [Burkholderiales bacterium]|nr:alpha/beta hydrolase [Burkholderiales bacterium]
MRADLNQVSRQAVLLVHGLWMGGWIMQALCLQLSRRGYAAHAFSYASTAQSLDEHARRLAARIAELREPVVHLVGHSLGGLVILRCLKNHGEQRIGRVVLIGTPVRACMAGRRLEDLAGGKRLLGASRDIWRNLPEVFRPGCELGVIAGSRPWGLGRMLVRLPGTNDGVVRLEETEVTGMRDRVVLPLSHSGMLVSAQVARQVAVFLERGAFDHGGRGVFERDGRGAAGRAGR